MDLPVLEVMKYPPGVYWHIEYHSLGKVQCSITSQNIKWAVMLLKNRDSTPFCHNILIDARSNGIQFFKLFNGIEIAYESQSASHLL